MENKYKERAKEVENNNYIEDTYCVITWPNSQMLFEQEWFDECILINDDCGLEMFGSSAYLVPIDRYNQFYGITQPLLYTKEQVEELLQKQRELCAENCWLIEETMEGDKIGKHFSTYEITPNKFIVPEKNSILNAKLKLE